MRLRTSGITEVRGRNAVRVYGTGTKGTASNVHVCLVTPYPATDDAVVGGVEAASLRLVTALLERPDVRVTIVAPAAESRVEVRSGAQIHWVASRPAVLPGIVRYWTTERRALLAVVHEVDADVVHVQAIAGWGLGLRGPRIFQMHGVPEEAVLHTQRRTRRLSSLVHVVIERRGRRSFPMVAVVGAHMVERFGSQFSGDVLVAENTVPDSYFTIERTPTPGQILHGGVVSPRKNTLGLLRAFRQVLDEVPGATLRIAGDKTSFRAYVDECTRFCAHAGIAHRVAFLGPISIEQMRDELSKAEALVLPSFNESAPVIICEAMAAGVPVVSSRRDGMVSMVEEGRTGFLIEPDDHVAIANAVVTLLTDTAGNHAMGVASRSAAAARFSSEVLASTMLSCYDKLVESGQ